MYSLPCLLGDACLVVPAACRVSVSLWLDPTSASDATTALTRRHARASPQCSAGQRTDFLPSLLAPRHGCLELLYGQGREGEGSYLTINPF